MASTKFKKTHSETITTTKQLGALAVKYPQVCLSGDHIRKVIPVPIPNTEVKLSEPMIVHTSVKVGIAGFLKLSCSFAAREFFYALLGNLNRRSPQKVSSSPWERRPR